MPSPEARGYLVVKVLQAALLGISAGAGYFGTLPPLQVKLDPEHEIETLIAETRAKANMLDLSFAMLSFPPDTFEYSSAAGAEKEHVAITMPFAVTWVQRVKALTDDDRLQTLFRIYADIETAFAPRALALRLAGLATNVKILSRTDLNPNSSEIWAVITGAAYTKRFYGAPNKEV